MRRFLQTCVVAASAILAVTVVTAGMNAPGIAKSERQNIAVTNSSKKSDRLPVTFTDQAAKPSQSKVTKSAGRRPPFGCDPMFSPIADPAQAGLYRRCAV